MKTRSESSKLVELRAKTDRQLIEIINHRLNAGLALARAVWTDSSEARAWQIYAEVRRLLPWVNNLTRADRRSFEVRLADLAALLEVLSSSRALTARAAAS